MTYKQWAEQYYRSAEILKKKAAELKQKIKSASEEQLAELTNNLRITNEMYYDCMSTAGELVWRKGEC